MGAAAAAGGGSAIGSAAATGVGVGVAISTGSRLTGESTVIGNSGELSSAAAAFFFRTVARGFVAAAGFVARVFVTTEGVSSVEARTAVAAGLAGTRRLTVFLEVVPFCSSVSSDWSAGSVINQ